MLFMFQLQPGLGLSVPRSVFYALQRTESHSDFEGLLLQGVYGEEKAHLMRKNKGADGTEKLQVAVLRKMKGKRLTYNCTNNLTVVILSMCF